MRTDRSATAGSMPRRSVAALAVAVLALPLAGCSDPGEQRRLSGPDQSRPGDRG